MVKSDRRLDPPRLIHKLRLVRAADPSHTLRLRDQVQALLQLAHGGGR